MEQKFYICEHCGNIVAMVKDAGVPIMCCGQKMKGPTEHPMMPEHYIEWVSLQTKQGNQRKALQPGAKPEVCFALCEGDEVTAVYAYCNLHSLWKAE